MIYEKQILLDTSTKVVLSAFTLSVFPGLLPPESLFTIGIISISIASFGLGGYYLFKGSKFKGKAKRVIKK